MRQSSWNAILGLSSGKGIDLAAHKRTKWSTYGEAVQVKPQAVCGVSAAPWTRCVRRNMRDRPDIDREKHCVAPASGWPVPNPTELRHQPVESFCSDCIQ
jgi:hypothetical protein